jgi:hypothetical protein
MEMNEEVKLAYERGIKEGRRTERKACIEDVYKYCQNDRDAKKIVLAINSRMVERFRIVDKDSA